MRGESLQRDHADVTEEVPTELPDAAANTRKPSFFVCDEVGNVRIDGVFVLLQVTQQHGSEPVGASGVCRAAPSR